MKKWVCPVCGYVHEGDTPPEVCPVCKVPGSKFTELKGDAKLAAEPDAAARAALRVQANDALAANLKRHAADTLDKVLFELSSQMKNAYSRSDA